MTPDAPRTEAPDLRAAMAEIWRDHYLGGGDDNPLGPVDATDLADADAVIEEMARRGITLSSATPAPERLDVERLDTARTEGLDDLRALSDAATPGPWTTVESYPGSTRRVLRTLTDQPHGFTGIHFSNDADADFTAAAVNYVRAALTPDETEGRSDG